jgi:hypothetical protein
VGIRYGGSAAVFAEYQLAQAVPGVLQVLIGEGPGPDELGSCLDGQAASVDEHLLGMVGWERVEPPATELGTSVFVDPAEQAQPRHSAIGEHVETHVRRWVGRCGQPEPLPGVGLKRGPRNQLLPLL